MRTSSLLFLILFAHCLYAQETKLLTGDPDFASLLGYNVGIEGDYAIARAPLHGGFGSNHAGAAYIFQNVAGTWTQVKKLLPPWGGAPGDDFGYSVDICKP